MARHVASTSHEFNAFRLCVWEGGSPISNAPEGPASWKLGKACERARRVVVVELVESKKMGGSKNIMVNPKKKK